MEKVTKELQKVRNKDIISLQSQLNGNLSEVLSWFVERKSTTVIQEKLKEKWGIEISRMSIWRFSQSHKWKPIIERGRIELAKHIAKIPCANKENRLLALQEVIEQGLKWSLKNITKEGRKIWELKLGAVTQAIKEAREELEPRTKNGIEISNKVVVINFPQVEDNGRKTGDQRLHPAAETVRVSNSATEI